MGSGGWIALMAIFFVGIIVIACVAGNKKRARLQEEGKIIKREDSFWKSAEYLTTVSNYTELRDAIKRADLTDLVGVTAEYDRGGRAQILFRCSHGWNGILELSGTTTDGKQNVYKLYFPAWRTMRYEVPQGLMQMNAFRTAIEKVFLDCDYDTTVQLRRMELKTKTDFI